MRYTPNKKSIFGETLEIFEEAVIEGGFSKYRAKQVLDWVYKKRVKSWDAMLNLPKDFKAWLVENYEMHVTRIILDKQSNDITNKFLVQLEDQSLIETVLIRAPQIGVGQKDSRKTVCVSIQVGCAYGCKFCASGLLGFKRNLLASEVVAQLMHMCEVEASDSGGKSNDSVSFDNIVFMGMGEPLANFDTLVRVLRILNAPWGMNIGARRITVSTSGLAPEIEKLGDEGMPIRLAISLHGATNEVRNKIMPINKRYPLEQLIPAAQSFQDKIGRMLTLEFILIEGINDSLDQARALAKIARKLHAHVNCIPYNKVEGLEWKRPSITRQNRFVDILKKERVSVTIRREKGHSINAACGQLKLKTELSMAASEKPPTSPFIKPE